MNHYTYMITVKNPTDSRRFYVGVRSCNGVPEQDRYMGSSKHFCKWQKENGVEGLYKTVLAVWPTRQEAVEHEMLLHDCFNIPRNKEFFNRSKQKSNGFDTSGTTISDEHKRKISEIGKKRITSEETKKKISLSKIGKPRSLETKEKLRAALLGTKRGFHSEETKKKQSAALKGRRWYNNGVNVKLCVEGTQPDGFVLGDPIRKKDFATGKKWFSNGTNEVFTYPDKAPNGWIAGRLKMKGKQNGI